jgi:flavodoxin
MEGYISNSALIQIMDPCVVYFSRTGNTKRLAQAIANAVNAPIMDISGTLPSTIENFDPLILGTPVEGSGPTKETTSFIESMNRREGGKSILFCTYRIFGNNRTMNAMEKELKRKGYQTILKVSKKGMKPDKEADFLEIISEVKKALEKQ